MILLLMLLLSLANHTKMEARNVKSEIVINGKKIVCSVCGRYATNVLTANGKIFAYCDQHISKEEVDQLEADLLEFEDDLKKTMDIIMQKDPRANDMEAK